MPVLTPTVQDAIRDWFRGTTFTAAPATLYLALYVTTPSGSAGGTEVTGGAYARVAVTTTTGFIADGAGRFKNATDIVFPTATASWGTVVGWGLMGALTLGTRYAMGTFAVSQTVASAKIAKVLAGALVADFAAV